MRITRKISAGYELFTTVLLPIIGLMFLVFPTVSMDYLINGTRKNFILTSNYRFQEKIMKTEQLYSNVWDMNLNRFNRKCLLTKLYDESGQKEKAVMTAKELLEKQVKIESTAIEEIRVEMEEILLKHQSSIKEGNSTMSHPGFKLQKW